MARKPSPAQLRARRAFAAKYGGKARKAPKRARNPTPMARRRSSAKKSSFRGVTRGINQSAMVDGALAGAAATVATGYLGPVYGPAAGLAAVGIFRKNATVQTLAGVSIGAALGAKLQLPGATGAMSPQGVL